MALDYGQFKLFKKFLQALEEYYPNHASLEHWKTRQRAKEASLKSQKIQNLQEI
jgi:hypothetical protein